MSMTLWSETLECYLVSLDVCVIVGTFNFIKIKISEAPNVLTEDWGTVHSFLSWQLSLLWESVWWFETDWS